MEFDFHYFTEHINSMASVFSVEVFPDGSYGNIRLVTGNAIFFKKSDDDHEKIGEDALYKTEFSPDEPYENYMPKDKNFAIEAPFRMKRCIPIYTPKECRCGFTSRLYR